MPQYVEVKGNVIEFPDGMASADIEQAIRANIMSIRPAAAVEAGRALNSIPRQFGLTARYLPEGLANMAQIGTEPIRNALSGLSNAVPMQGGEGADNPLMMDRKPAARMLPLGQAVSSLADAAGLPTPRGANERVVGEATRLMAGGGGLVKTAQFAAGKAPALMQTAVEKVAQFLAANPGQQVAAAGGAGLAGGASREAGGGPGMQALTALVGGVAGGSSAQAADDVARSGVAALRNLLPGQQQLVQQRIDQRINITLQNQGIDPATITPAMRSVLREQVGKAMNMGDLNPQAVARLADFTRLGMTPTRARLTLDPFDVTQEANASKLAAATGSREARLPQIAQENNQRLISLVDEMGGARPVDTFGQGSAVAGAIQAQDDALRSGVTSLYQQARDTSGRSAQLDGAAFTRQASQALDDGLLGGALPPSVEAHLNRIAQGEVPFTVDYAEQLKTAIGNLQRATTDGQTRMALGVVRRALDETPLMPAPQVNPGNLPAIPGTVPPSPATMGQQSIDAFNQARQAARQRFAWQESSPAIQRALDGANADTFIQQNILSKAAGFEGVARAAQTINANPAARDAVRTSIVQHLKDASIGKGGTSQTGNFSGRGMEAALKDIGDRKLGLFFEPAEVETLKAMARTGAFEVFQPRGSAVNNSNTAAGIGGLLQGVSKFVKPLASKLPLGEQLVNQPLDSLTLWSMQGPATNVPRGLLMPRPRPPMGQGLLLPGIAAGGTAAGLLAGP